MNPLSNALNHPKTSAAGLLIAIVTIASVFSQQGVTLGHAGTGNIVTLIAAVAAALLGLLAKDPGGASSASASSTAKLGVWALIALLLPLPFMQGCTQAQKVSVAQEIVNLMPIFVSTADAVNAAVAGVDPATALVMGSLTAGINALGPQLVQGAQAYLANPTQTNLQLLQALVTQAQQNTNAALLAAGKIVNPASQASAVKWVNSIAVITTSLLGLVQSISTKAQVAQMAKSTKVSLAMVRPYIQERALGLQIARIQRDTGLPLVGAVTPDSFFAYEARAGF